MKKYLLIVILTVAVVLRLWKLSSVPVSLFGDELDVGYHAYSILKTGKDYYGNSWPIHFHSIAEYRTPLYLYSAVPTVAIFGITPLGVRLPAAIFGILSVFIMYLLTKEVLSYGQPSVKFHYRSLLAAAIMAVNPWSLQYSRAGFEVTLMLFLLLLGLYLFFKAFVKGNRLWLSAVCFALTPWVYSTAKLFTPFLLVFLLLAWRKEILKIQLRYILYTVAALLIVGGPIAYDTVFGKATQRFSYISIFTDPTTDTEVGTSRTIDARVRGEEGVGLKPTILDRTIHNKYTFWGKNVINNYFRAFSTDFLFVKGDMNLRHSIGTGEFYKIEMVALIAGLIFFLISKRDIRIKLLITFWILVGVVPSAITREGGYHATRLILILPPLILLIAYGAKEIMTRNRYLGFIYLFIWLFSFGSYVHQYYVHYPWESERWWHAGWGEAISSVKEVDNNYDKVVISMSGEPAWIFFAGHYAYPPVRWQNYFPIGNYADLEGVGKVSHIDKYYFGTYPGGLYEWGKLLDKKILFLANANDVKLNLILEPERKPGDIDLIKTITFPSGEPAFYLFTGTK